jgi:hypothetical protein
MASWVEPHGEMLTGCPICKGACDETKRCKMCDGEFLEEELESGVCEDCYSKLVMKYKYNPIGCFKLAREEKQSVKINDFLVSQFTEIQIEEILLKEIVGLASFSPIDCTQFIENDKDWFVKQALEEVK